MKTIDEAIERLAPEQRSEWNELQLGALDPLDTLDSWSAEHRMAVRTALADYASSQSDAAMVVRKFTAWSSRLGALSACLVAREAARHVPACDSHPLWIIDAAERVARGEGFSDECFPMVSRSSAATRSIWAARDSANCASRSVVAWRSGNNMASEQFALQCVVAAAEAYAENFEDCLSALVFERERLCSSIAESLRTGSLRDWIG